MRVSREQAAENRERIIAVASGLFRERGFNGVGVADLMQSAGLTHGGFYGHFESKEDLMAQASARALDGSRDLWRDLASEHPDRPLDAVLDHYLSSAHRDRPQHGCLLTSLGSDVARQGVDVRRTVTERFTSMIGLIESWIPGRSQAAKRRRALAAYSTMVGAMMLARMVDDPELSDEILAASRANLPGGQG